MRVPSFLLLALHVSSHFYLPAVSGAQHPLLGMVLEPDEGIQGAKTGG